MLKDLRFYAQFPTQNWFVLAPDQLYDARGRSMRITCGSPTR